MKSIKQLLDEQELVVGLTIQQVCQPWVAKVYADAGADFVFIDTEHGWFNGQDFSNLALAARLCGLPLVAKSAYVDRASITRLLDAGATGIQLPMSESAAQLEDVVRFTKFPPLGERAASPGMGNTGYDTVDVVEWLKRANEETVVLAHIESRAGLEHADEILQVPGVDIMFVGMFDLTVSLGRAAQFDHPDVAKATDRLIAKAKERGKVAGMWVPTYEAATPWIKKGVRFFELTSDQGFILAGARQLMARFRGEKPGAGLEGAHF